MEAIIKYARLNTDHLTVFNEEKYTYSLLGKKRFLSLNEVEHVNIGSI